MSTAIAGVAPATEKEVTIMTVWPSIAATAFWPLVGTTFCQRHRDHPVWPADHRLAGILALVSIPFILPVYFHMLIPKLPFVVFGVPNPACRRYRLTNKRVVVEQAFRWRRTAKCFAGPFRLDRSRRSARSGVVSRRRPDLPQWSDRNLPSLGSPSSRAFRQTCMKARNGLRGRSKGSRRRRGCLTRYRIPRRRSVVRCICHHLSGGSYPRNHVRL